ncbi:MAG: hypothetical protein ACXQTZ_01800, partial [Candidatus Alkanophagales archaeon]
MATDYVAIDLDKLRGQAPYKVYVAVKKVGWGTLKRLRVEIKHSCAEPIVYSLITIMIEVFSACLLPFFIALILP